MLEEIVVSPDNPYFDSRANCNAILETATNRLIAACRTSHIPDDTQVIGAVAFADIDTLEQLTLPASVTRIEWNAFNGCKNLSEVLFPSQLSYVGDEAFHHTAWLAKQPQGMVIMGKVLYPDEADWDMFEEAAGISKYRHRKEETERKLATTEDNLLRIGDKVSELELQLEPLKQQSEKAKKYLELKDELQGVEVAVWLDTLEKLSAAAKKAEEDYASASFVLQQAHDDVKKLYAQSEQLGAELRHKDEELENIRSQVSMLEATHQQLDGQMAVLQGNIRNNEDNIQRIEEELRGQEDRSGGIAAQMDETRERIAQIETDLTEKRGQLEKLQQELAAMTANTEGITRQFLELRAAESNLTADLAGREADIRGLETSLAENEQRKQELQADITAGKARKETAEDEWNVCRNQLRNVQEDVTAANNTISGYAMRQENRRKKVQELSDELREITATLDSVQAKTRVFRAMERDFENYQKSVRMVMQESQRGALRNIHGPVSRLIRTDDEFTVAMEIAMGGALQQIVVDSESDAKAAMAYLKRTGGGRATFLPISVIKGKLLSESGLEGCRGYVGIASELIRSESRYRGIVENLLGRTVIAEDIDSAIAMAKKYNNRFKIVTLDGQVVNAGGSMTGGSVNKESGILSRANELERLNRQSEQLRPLQHHADDHSQASASAHD